MKLDEQRTLFEDWISHTPWKWSIQRWPDDDRTYASPGQYRYFEVELAWEAWQEAVSHCES